MLEALLEEPYYRLAPPKSTGKELFHLPYVLDAANQPTILYDNAANALFADAEKLWIGTTKGDVFAFEL